MSVSPSSSQLFFEINNLYMIFVMFLYKIFEKRQHISSIMNHSVSLMKKKVYESHQFTSSKHHIFALFVFNIVFLDYSFFIRYTCQFQFFGSIGIQISRILESLKQISYLLQICLLFSNKERKTTKILNKITKQIRYSFKINTISIIIIGLLVFLTLYNSKKLYKRKQHISLLKQVAKFLKNPKNNPIVPLFPLWLNDIEIIWDVGLGCENESIDQGRAYVDKNINIALCFFVRYLTYSGYGGVIYVNSGSYSMNINYSMFYNCVCSSDGGAIYFYSSNSCLKMICANSCSASYEHFHFARLFASHVNQVGYISVSNCSYTTSGSCPICLLDGDQRADNSNSSMNNAYMYSGIWIYSSSSFTSSYCTFSNNKVSNNVCLRFYSESGTISISYSNIVHNNSPYLGVVTVEGAGSRKMMYCIFQNNQNYLFYVIQGSLEVSHSFIDHSTSFSTLTAVSTTNNSFAYIMTFQMQFFNSHHCNADIPLPQRTLENSPIKSLEETIRDTPKETIHRSYAELVCTNQMANKREINVIYAFLYPVIILMIS